MNTNTLKQIARILLLLWNQPEADAIRAEALHYWRVIKWSVRFLAVFALLMLYVAMDHPTFAGWTGIIVTFAVAGWVLFEWGVVVVVCEHLGAYWGPLRDAKKIASFIGETVAYMLVLYTAFIFWPVKGKLWPMFTGLLVITLIVAAFRGWQTKILDWVLRIYLAVAIIIVVLYMFVPEGYKVVTAYSNQLYKLQVGKSQISLNVTKEGNAKYLQLKALCASIDLPIPSATRFRQRRPKSYKMMKIRCAAMERMWKVYGRVLSNISEYPPQRIGESPRRIRPDEFPIHPIWCEKGTSDCRCKMRPASRWRHAKDVQGAVYDGHVIWLTKASTLELPDVKKACRPFLQFNQRCLWKTHEVPPRRRKRYLKRWCAKSRRAERRVAWAMRVCIRAILAHPHTKTTVGQLPELDLSGHEWRIVFKKDSGDIQVPPAKGTIAVECSHRAP